MRPPDAPPTVIRPPPAPEIAADVFARLAQPLLALAAEAARDPRPDPRAIAAEARRRAEGFEAAALAASLKPGPIAEARDALLAVLDTRVRSNPALPPGRWRRAARRALPGLAAGGAERIAAARGRAEARGAPGRDLARFLRHCEEAVRAAPPAGAAAGPPWGAIVPLAVLLALALWSGMAEWRYARGLLRPLAGAEAAVAEAGDDPARAAEALDGVARAAEAIALRAGNGPLGLAPFLGPYAPGRLARARYAAAADRLLPPLLAGALAEALATEGGSREAYDTIRARAILDGEAPWQPAFLAGWIEARAGADALLGRLAPHALALSGSRPGLPAFDPLLLAQARGIAAEGDPADFAFLELTRDPRARALPGWSTTAIPGLGDILVRRSGQPLAQPVPGLFTAAGWAYARDGGAAHAIARMTGAWLGVTRTAAPAPVSEAAVLDRLQGATLDAWTARLADLRVRPFTDRAGALLVSGVLGQARAPLETLFRATWHEVGGDDPARPTAERQRAAAAFGPAIRFLDEGHMAAITRLFAGLNIALAATAKEARPGQDELLGAADRAASVAALTQAPRLVGQVVEDVLAQAAATRGGSGGPPAAARWLTELAGACRGVVEDRYPFAPGAGDADYPALRAFLGPDGALSRFIAADLAPYLDIGAAPWTWKPEARLSGFTQDSAAFLYRATRAGRLLFPGAGGGGFSLAMLAQSGAETTVATLGGASATIDAAGQPSPLAWPGAEPAAGFTLGSGSGAGARWPGAWGLLRFLDGAHPRARDDGRRFLLDVRATGQRIFLEMVFPEPDNLAAARLGLRGLACPRQL